jgi:hypothetical protein
MNTHFANLSAKQLYGLALTLAGQDVSIDDKLYSALHIADMCRLNKEFQITYCDTQKVWRELYRKDVSSNLPREHVKEKYIQALIGSNTGDLVADVLAAVNNNHMKLAKILINQATDKELREILDNIDDREIIQYILSIK